MKCHHSEYDIVLKKFDMSTSYCLNKNNLYLCDCISSAKLLNGRAGGVV